MSQHRSRGRSSVLVAVVATFPLVAAVACSTSKQPEPVEIGDCYYGFEESLVGHAVKAPVRRLPCTDADARLEVVAILGPGQSNSCPTRRIGGGINVADVSHSFEEDGKVICLVSRSSGR